MKNVTIAIATLSCLMALTACGKAKAPATAAIEKAGEAAAKAGEAAKAATDEGLEKAANAAEAAKKRGEYEALYTESETKLAAATQKLDALTARETARLERVKAANAERVEALPENLRALIPDGLDLDAQAAQLARVEALATEPTFPAGTRRGSGKAPALVIPEACKAEAERHGKDPEQWFKTVWSLPHRRKARGEA